MKPSKIMSMIAVTALSAVAVVISSSSPASAEKEVKWSSYNNGPSLTAQQSFTMQWRCPSYAPYLLSVGVQGSGQGYRRDPSTGKVIGTDTKVRTDSVTTANYPGYVTVSYSNTSSYEDRPAVRVGMKLSLECSSVNPGQLPRELRVETVGYTSPDFETVNWDRKWIKINTQCPAGNRIDHAGAEYDHDAIYQPWQEVHMGPTDLWALYASTKSPETQRRPITQYLVCIPN